MIARRGNRCKCKQGVLSYLYDLPRGEDAGGWKTLTLKMHQSNLLVFEVGSYL